MKFKNLMLALSIAITSTFVMAKAVDYKIDPTHTATVFSWNHLGFSVPSANFNDIQGVISVDNTQPEKSFVNVVIPVSSINTNVPIFDKKLQEKDWIDAAKYPTINFKSSKVETTDQKNFKITGNLTIKGITKPVVLDAILNKQADHPILKVPAIGFNASTRFKRSDFGISAYTPDVGDLIEVNITTEALAVIDVLSSSSATTTKSALHHSTITVTEKTLANRFKENKYLI